jgi:hypothetical protein
MEIVDTRPAQFLKLSAWATWYPLFALDEYLVIHCLEPEGTVLEKISQ